MVDVSERFTTIRNLAVVHGEGNSVKVMIFKFSFSAATYHLWRERYSRFSNRIDVIVWEGNIAQL